MYRPRPRTTRILVFREEFEHDATLEDIDAIHRSRGALSCGYHYVVRKDGTVEQGREDSVIGWHSPGRNDDAVAIAYIVEPGGSVSDEQLSNGLLETLRVKYPKAPVEHHEDPR